MPFHTEAFTQIRFDKYARIHTKAFRHRLFFRESQKLWHREAFTQRIFYTQKLLHTSFSRRSFYTELLSTGAFTHRRLYTQKLVHAEAFTHRSFCTDKPLHTNGFPQKNRFDRAAFTHFKKSQFYVSLDVRPSYRAKRLHPALENCNWRWTIILRERVAPDLVKSQFYISFISRETVVPDVSKWIKSQFYTNSWTLKNLSFPSHVRPSLVHRSQKDPNPKRIELKVRHPKALKHSGRTPTPQQPLALRDCFWLVSSCKGYLMAFFGMGSIAMSNICDTRDTQKNA